MGIEQQEYRQRQREIMSKIGEGTAIFRSAPMATMHNALQQDPENEFTHTTIGWNMLEKGSEKPELTAAVKEQFGLGEEEAAGIVEKFTDYLCQHRFIEGVEPRRFG